MPKSINPIFDKTDQPKPIKEPEPRKVRDDKTKQVKFPVTEFERRELRKGAIAAGLYGKQTAYNTDLLLRTIHEWGEAQEIEYKDTGQYMTTNPTIILHGRLEDIMLKWGTSKRETVHRLMINALRRGLQ